METAAPPGTPPRRHGPALSRADARVAPFAKCTGWVAHLWPPRHPRKEAPQSTVTQHTTTRNNATKCNKHLGTVYILYTGKKRDMHRYAMTAIIDVLKDWSWQRASMGNQSHLQRMMPPLAPSSNFINVCLWAAMHAQHFDLIAAHCPRVISRVQEYHNKP